MKNVIKICLVLLVAIVIMGSAVYAALDCTVSISTTKTEFSKNEEFTVNVNLSDIQSEKGVIAFSATLQYDKDVLTLVKMEGQNGWSSSPSYNEENGKLVMDRNNVTNSDETILKITFKVNGNSKQTTSINLNDISVSDATTPVKKISTISKSITIKQETIQNPSSGSGTNNSQNTNTVISQTPENSTNTITNNNQNTITIGNTTSTNTTTTTNVSGDITATTSKLPQTGTDNTINILLFIATIGAIISFIGFVRIK
jgi:LPXTG-motif cell wall-anchored protein